MDHPPKKRKHKKKHEDKESDVEIILNEEADAEIQILNESIHRSGKKRISTQPIQKVREENDDPQPSTSTFRPSAPPETGKVAEEKAFQKFMWNNFPLSHSIFQNGPPENMNYSTRQSFQKYMAHARKFRPFTQTIDFQTIHVDFRKPMRLQEASQGNLKHLKQTLDDLSNDMNNKLNRFIDLTKQIHKIRVETNYGNFTGDFSYPEISKSNLNRNLVCSLIRTKAQFDEAMNDCFAFALNDQKGSSMKKIKENITTNGKYTCDVSKHPIRAHNEQMRPDIERIVEHMCMELDTLTLPAFKTKRELYAYVTDLVNAKAIHSETPPKTLNKEVSYVFEVMYTFVNKKRHLASESKLLYHIRDVLKDKMNTLIEPPPPLNLNTNNNNESLFTMEECQFNKNMIDRHPQLHAEFYKGLPERPDRETIDRFKHYMKLREYRQFAPPKDNQDDSLTLKLDKERTIIPETLRCGDKVILTENGKESRTTYMVSSFPAEDSVYIYSIENPEIVQRVLRENLRRDWNTYPLVDTTIRPSKPGHS